MESLRWILLAAGVAALVGIIWLYFRHKSEQAVELGSGRTDANHDDPIDAQIRQHDEPPADAEPAPMPEIGDAELSPVRRVSPLLESTRLEPTRREPTLDTPGDRPEVDPFPVEHQAPRWKQPTFTRTHPDPQETEGFSDAEGVIGTVRRTVLDTANPTSGSLFRQRQPTPHFNYQQKPKHGTDDPTEPTDAALHHASEPVAPQSVAVAPTPAPQADTQADTQVIALLIVHPEGRPFPGDAVQDLIEDVGFEYGALSIYHYADEFGQTLFSLMNGVKPGLFNRGDVHSFSTPVLALFMQIPMPEQSETLVLDRLIDTARDMAEQLGGELLDDRREPLSSESIDRYRELLAS